MICLWFNPDDVHWRPAQSLERISCGWTWDFRWLWFGVQVETCS